MKHLQGTRSGHISKLTRVIQDRIKRDGPITFAEFMDAALYSPFGGYYSRQGVERTTDDYFTSPHAHPSFGALLAIQLQEMYKAMGDPAPFTVLEQGAGDGVLARDVLAYAQRLDAKFYSRLEYLIFDRGQTPNSGSQSKTSASIPYKNITGCLLSNELLDALAVHRFVIRGGRIMELRVGLTDDRFVDIEVVPENNIIQDRISPFLDRLPEGYRGEVNVGIGGWADDVAQALTRGFVLTIDYGYESHQLYSPKRSTGSLRTYRDHMANDDAYDLPGSRDITAHVDFTAYSREMQRAGFSKIGTTKQDKFLTRLGLRTMIRGLRTRRLSQAALNANRMSMLELIRPGGLGEFVVVAHSKGIETNQLQGFDDNACVPPDFKLPVPILNNSHAALPLMAAKHPSAALLTGHTWNDLIGHPQPD